MSGEYVVGGPQRSRSPLREKENKGKENKVLPGNGSASSGAAASIDPSDIESSISAAKAGVAGEVKTAISVLEKSVMGQFTTALRRTAEAQHSKNVATDHRLDALEKRMDLL